MPNNPSSLKDTIDNSIKDKISKTKFYLPRWRNVYLTNKSIGDEIKYVFDRKNRKPALGN